MLKKWIKKIFGGDSDELPDISKTQWYTKDEIKRFQEKRLQKLVEYAYKQIPYYKKLFDQKHIRPKDIQKLEDLAKIPVLTRKEAVENYNSLINPELINFTHYSGATTGQRLKWVSSKPWAEVFTATLWRGFSWAGLDPQQRVVSFYSRNIGEITKESFIIREAYDVNKIERELEQIKKFDPHFAYCYASAAYLMAQHLLKNGIRMPLKGVITTSDQLYLHYKEDIEEAFQCKVYNNYGCNDGGAWGAECEARTGFHHDFERSIIEFDSNGKMIATDLWNYAMPLIRYENGDSGRWLDTTCSCKRAMPLFSVQGRINDYIITSTQVFSPTAIDVLIQKNVSIGDIQIVQQTDRNIEIFFVRKPGYSLEDIKNCLEPFTKHLQEMEVVITEKEKIERPTSNKKRICMNHSKQTLENFFQRN